MAYVQCISNYHAYVCGLDDNIIGIHVNSYTHQEEFVDTKGVIKHHIWKDRQHNGQQKKGQTAIYKTLHRKLNIDQHEPHNKRG